MAKNRYMSMDLNALRTFVILYQEGNMRKATTKLHVSQPALSHTLSKLRETFDDDLFIKILFICKNYIFGLVFKVLFKCV